MNATPRAVHLMIEHRDGTTSTATITIDDVASDASAEAWPFIDAIRAMLVDRHRANVAAAVEDLKHVLGALNGRVPPRLWQSAGALLGLVEAPVPPTVTARR